MVQIPESSFGTKPNFKINMSIEFDLVVIENPYRFTIG